MFDPESHPDYFVDNGQDPEKRQADTPKIDFTEQGGDDPDPKPETVKPRRRHRKAMAIVVAVCCAVIGSLLYVRYFNPYAEEASVTGYITGVERRGIIFKTYEGDMISQSNLTDTSRIYSRDFTFSVPDKAVAREIQSYQGTGRPVRLWYSKYYGMLPWRGASTNVVQKIEVLPQ